MELKDFVAQSIIQIAEGLAEARSKTHAHGVEINPPLTKSAGAGVVPDVYVNHRNGVNVVPQFVTFDVLVNAESTDAVDGKGKISVVGLSIGGGASVESKNTNSSRITFSIPVCWSPSREAKCPDETAQDRDEPVEGRGGLRFRPGAW